MMRVLALLMLPLAAMGLLAAHDTAQYRSDATVASGIRRQVPIVDAMVRLSEQLHNEELSAGIALRASEVGLSPASISHLLGYNQAVNTASLRAGTDSAIAALGRASPVSAAQIDSLRRQVDSKTIDPGAATQGFVTLDGEVGARLGPLLSSLGDAAEQVGGGGGRLSKALGNLQASTDALRYGAAQSTDFIDVVLSPADQASAALVRFGADTAQYDAAASVLATTSAGNVSATWQRMKARSDVGLFDQTLTTMQEGRGGPSGADAIAAVFKGAVTRDDVLFSIVGSTSQVVGRTASSLQSSSAATYDEWLLGSVLLGLTLVGVAFIFARSITRPLAKLAEWARSVGTGHLAVEPAPARGPRETKLVGEAFNNLVSNLVLLESKARALASCDFDDPVLAEQLPGPLGESIAGSARLLSGSIEERKALEQRLAHQALHDTLTGLANRTLFLDRVGQALRRAQRHATPLAVLFLDIDDFKTVNDSLGHATGDELLVAVAQRIIQVARAGDTVARLGGDEFAILLESGDMPRTAEELAGRIAQALQPSFHFGDAEVAVRVSVGIALGQPPDDAPGDLLRDADVAMYMAKRNGKGRFEMAHPGMQDEALKRLAITADLRHALDNGELAVFYQPIVKAGDLTPVGAEALVRWHHPRRGLILPHEFVEVAESTGLIVPLGSWVLKQACNQTAAWLRAGVVDDSFYISVNLSARQLAEPSLVDDVGGALRESGLRPAALVLEITESALMLDFDAGLARLQSLKDLGLRLALDDYGTGYSSLNRLGQLPVDIVKIDKSFIDRLTQSREGSALVQSVIDVTSALGLSTIAEGVEEEDQCTALAEMGCSHIQGYLFARPMPPTEAAGALQRLGADWTSSTEHGHEDEDDEHEHEHDAKLTAAHSP
jgi:diguanylate cyclase (GGDEF)-like protein